MNSKGVAFFIPSLSSQQTLLKKFSTPEQWDKLAKNIAANGLGNYKCLGSIKDVAFPPVINTEVPAAFVLQTPQGKVILPFPESPKALTFVCEESTGLYREAANILSLIQELSL